MFHKVSDGDELRPTAQTDNCTHQLHTAILWVEEHEMNIVELKSWEQARGGQLFEAGA
jgi:hypothetical protein